MKKSILILTTLFFVSGTLSAQKKPTKKSVTETSKITTDSPPPMMSVSPEEKKYENERTERITSHKKNIDSINKSDCACYAKDKNGFYFWDSKIDLKEIDDEETSKIIEKLKKL